METAHCSFTHPQPLVCFELCFELIIILSFLYRRLALHDSLVIDETPVEGGKFALPDEPDNDDAGQTEKTGEQSTNILI